MNATVKVSLPADDDGFLSQECPSCSKRFKAVFGDGSDKLIGHCPYCGHAEEGCWWTAEQAEYLSKVAADQVVGPLLDDFTQDMNRISKPGDFLQISASVRHDPPPPQPTEPNDPMPILTFACCSERIKHDGTNKELHCVICGNLVNVAPSTGAV